MNEYNLHDIEILQTLKKIRQTNEQIALHLKFHKPEGLVIRQLQEHKAMLVRQLEELLADLNVNLPAVA